MSEDNEPGFPYMGFCPIQVYTPDKHDPNECPYCKDDIPGEPYDDDDRDCLDCTEPFWADCRDCYKNRRRQGAK